MHTQTRKTTVTFTRPFQLDGFEAVLPAGMYSMESENDVLDGMFLPDCLRTSVLIQLHSTPGSLGYSQTLTVSWKALEAALLWDRTSAVAPTEPGLEEMPLGPIARLPMHRDGSDKLEQTLVRHEPATRAPLEPAARQASRANKKALFQRHGTESR
jgi:hypothetical protein